MKFVYCGYDFAIDSLLRLLDAGHECLGILSFPCDQVFSFNQRLHDLAKQISVPITEDRPDREVIDRYINRGAEVVLSMGYLYKIPFIDDGRCYGVNVHPSLLPRGRGLMPIPHMIMYAPEVAGVTVHKITPDYDAGDILMQKPIEIGLRDNVESISVRMAMAMPDMVVQLFSDLPRYWRGAAPQDVHCVEDFPAPTDEMRRLDFAGDVRHIEDQHRAFGRFGVLFSLQGDIWAAYHLRVWQEDHLHEPGSVVYASALDMVIAARDGFVLIQAAEKL